MKTTFYVGLLTRDNKPVNISEVVALASIHFDSFTAYQALGVWNGQVEPSLVIEVIAAWDNHMAERFATDAANTFNQSAVIIYRSEGHLKNIYNSKGE